ncbi:MAG: F-type H+-transporting ATPase subunit epsilon [Thermosediminibacterales bacterium]|nr:F-type H+-transporting ATPase subunit epsilon [Thermosediminibacterales bacterium]MDK2835999.1 F-type H+-transporting ATPase subunit epsilon [Thermosediminibacterales bacterium]
MDKSFRLKIITPEGIYFDEPVEGLVVKAMDGDMGILPEHIPLITGLKIGVLKIKRGGETLELALGGGFIKVNHNETTIIAKSAERPEEIDVDRALAAKKRAEKRLKLVKEEADVIRIKAALRRANIRLKVAKKER